MKNEILVKKVISRIKEECYLQWLQPLDAVVPRSMSLRDVENSNFVKDKVMYECI